MTKSLKIVAGVAAFCVVILTATVIFFSIIDPNDYKGDIVAFVKERTGRDLKLDGDLSVTFYPWLGVQVGGVTLGQAPGFGDGPFLRADSIQVRAKVLPLLVKSIEMDIVRVDNPEIHLARNAEGLSNWDDLIKADDESPKTSPLRLAGIAIGGVDIRNGLFTWRDDAAGRFVKFAELNTSSGPLAFDKPLELKASTYVSATRPAVLGTVTVQGTLAYDLDGERLIVDAFQTTGEFTGKSLPDGKANLNVSTAAEIDFDAETATFKHLTLNALGTTVQGSLNASKIKSERPAASAEVSLTGSDIAAIFKALQIEPLAGELYKLPERSFSATVTVDGDMKSRTLHIPELKGKVLGASFSGNITAAHLNGERPAIKGELIGKGPDFPILMKLISQFEGGNSRKLKRLAKALDGVNVRGFDIATQFDADLGSGKATVSKLAASALGTSVTGSLMASALNTQTPAVRGEFAAKGSDFPILLQCGSVFENGEEGALSSLAQRLARSTNKAFTFAGRFDANLKTRNVNVSDLATEILGLSAKGKLVAAKDAVSGELSLEGAELEDLFRALGQPALAKRVRSVGAHTRVGGSPNNLTLHPLEISVSLTPDAPASDPMDLVLNTAANANLETDTLRLSALRVSGLGLDIQGDLDASHFRSDKVTYKGDAKLAPINLRTFLRRVNQPLPDSVDPTTFQKVAASGSIAGSMNRIAVDNLSLEVDDSRLTGTVNIDNFTAPDILFALALDKINVDRYRAPGKKSRGSSDRPATGKTRATSPDAALPVEALRDLKLTGELNVGQMTVSDMKLTDVKLSIKARDGKIAFDPVGAALYRGTYSGAFGIDATGSVAKVDLESRLEAVEVEPLLVDLNGRSRLRGRGDLAARFRAVGADAEALKNSVTGQARLAFRDGAVRGINLGKLLRSVKGDLFSLDESESTDFTELDATVDCTDGVCQNQDLSLKSPLLRVGGAGTMVDLRTDRIDYTLQVTVVGSAAGQGGPGLEKLKGKTVPVKITGTTSDPKFAPDVAGIARREIEDQLQKRLGKHLPGDSKAEDSQKPIQDELKKLLPF